MMRIFYKPYVQICFAGIVFVCLTILTTYPLIWNVGDSIYGYPGDSWGAIWSFWKDSHGLLTNNSPPWWSDLIGAPFGVVFSKGVYLPLHYWGLALTVLSNEIVAWNLMISLGFCLSALSAYWLARALWQSEWGSILAGISYGFCPYLYWHATQHVDLSHIEFIPLYILSLLYLYQKRNYISAILCGLAFATVLCFNFFYGFFMAIATVVLLACWVIYTLKSKGPSFNWKSVRLSLLALLVALLVSFPWTYRTVVSVLFNPSFDVVGASAGHRPFADLFAVSARPWDYLLPSVDHPVLGEFSKRAYDSIEGWDLAPTEIVMPDNIGGRKWILKSTYLQERHVFLGYTAFALAVYGVILAFGKRKRSKTDREHFAILFFVVLFGVSVLCSMPPVMPIGQLISTLWPSCPDWQIPTPSYFLHRLAPMFRCYVRFGIVAVLCIAVLAAFGMRELLQMQKKPWKKSIIVSLIFSLVIFELLHLPHHTSFATIPEEYKWAAEEPGDFILADYPFYWSHGTFYQRVHNKRLLFGTSTDIYKKMLPFIYDLSKPGTVEQLGALGVRYVILHTVDYFPLDPVGGPSSHLRISKPLSKDVPGLKLIKTTPTAQIFEVTNDSAVMMIWPDPTPTKDTEEVWLSHRTWRWKSDTQRFYLFNAGREPIRVTLTGKSSRCEGKFRILGKAESKGNSKPLQWNSGRISLADIVCPPGQTVVEVSLPTEINGKETAWSELSVDVVAK